MKDKIFSKIYEVSNILEIIISVILSIVILLLAFRLVINIFDYNYLTTDEDVFSFFLVNAMNLAVGVELVKMLCKHTPSTVVEVLLFAIARQIIVSHGTVFDMLAGVTCIIGLFATRKFLFTSKDEK